ncbi:MAG TPA: DUF305 domain-containing protein [Trueperaceae bacterium]|nr:DUF305 domain-containing protein [Trueperaceae bacterium]
MHYRWNIATVLLAGLAAAAVAESVHHPPGDPASPAGSVGAKEHVSHSAMPGLESLSNEEFEVAFMSMMVAHHQGAVAMADWVLERGDDPDVMAAAQAVKKAQVPEIEQMTSWLREWYDSGVDVTWADMMTDDMRGVSGTLQEGTDADLAFLAAMIHHHQGAIDMAQVALENAEHQELRDIARDIILTQVEEVHQYQTWLVQVGE